MELGDTEIQKAVVFVSDLAKWEGEVGIYIVSGLQKLKHFLESSKRENISPDVYDKVKEICEKLKKN